MTNSIREVIRKLVEENSSKGVEFVVVKVEDTYANIEPDKIYVDQDNYAVIEGEVLVKASTPDVSEEEPVEEEILEKEVGSLKEDSIREEEEVESTESEEPQDSQEPVSENSEEPQETESEGDVTEEEDVESLKEV